MEPLSAQDFVPASITNEHTHPNEEEEDRCEICHDAISERGIAEPCQHAVFDFVCLVKWIKTNIKTNATCPICRAQVEIVRCRSNTGGLDRIYKIPKPVALEGKGPLSMNPDSISPDGTSLRRSPGVVRPADHYSTDQALLHRRHVYQTKSYSYHVGSNRVSRYQDPTHRQFQNDPDLRRRATIWMRREFRVFEFLQGSHSEPIPEQPYQAEFLLTYTLLLLKSVDMQDASGTAQAILSEKLGKENAQLFFHELRNWLRSPYTTLEEWDRNVQYGRQDPAGENVARAHQSQDSRQIPRDRLTAVLAGRVSKNRREQSSPDTAHRRTIER